MCHLDVPALLGQRGSSGPVLPIRDQLLQSMGEIYSGVIEEQWGGQEFLGRVEWEGGGLGDFGNFWAELNGRGEVLGDFGNFWAEFNGKGEVLRDLGNFGPG